MRSYLAIVRFETAKAVRARIAWVTVLLPSIVAAGFVVWDRIARQVRLIVDAGGAELESVYPSFARGAGNGLVLGGILLLLHSTMLVSNEGHWRTFKTIMLRPHRRTTWMLGKFTLTVMLAGAVVAGVAGSAWIAGAAMGEFSDIKEAGFDYVYFTSGEMLRHASGAVALALAPMIALAAFGLMFSTMTDHSGVAASAGLGAYIMLETAKESAEEGGRFLFNRYLPSLLDTSYFQELRGFAEGMSDAGWDRSEFYYNIGTPLVSALVFLAVAVVVFRRRNFLV